MKIATCSFFEQSCKRICLIILFSFLFFSGLHSQEKRFITVAADGSGDFKTITEAVQSLPMFNYQRTVIFIKNGIYEEKIKIDQDYITLRGESREKTIMRYSQLRTDWIAKKDSIGPAVINLSGDDFILENMTVINTQPQVGPHAFTIYGTGTRTIILNCSVISNGGDTVSLWNYKTGMYYHAGCYFEGAVDFVCPRGWCFIRDSKFYELAKTAAIWHAGGYDRDQKFVIVNSSFDGVKDFELGRHHYEAQFYLLNCNFSENMSTKKIYRVVNSDSTKNRPFNWGERYFFYDCKSSNEKINWIKNNLITSDKNIKPSEITPAWTFSGRWDPESKAGPKIISITREKNELLLFFDEPVTILEDPVILINSKITLKYSSGGGSNTIKFHSSDNLNLDKWDNLVLLKGKAIGSLASANERSVDFEQVLSLVKR